jgi:hypothetical protein
MKGFEKPPRAIHGRFSIFGRVMFLCGGRSSRSTPRSTELEREITCDNCLAKLERIDRDLAARARDRDEPPKQRELFRPGLRLVGGAK